MIMTGLTQAPTLMPDPMIGDFCRLVCDTLKSSGNVLIPCFSSGTVLLLGLNSYKLLNNTKYLLDPDWFMKISTCFH